MLDVKFVNQLSNTQLLIFFRAQGRNFISCEKIFYSELGSVYIKAVDKNDFTMLYRISDKNIITYNRDRIPPEAWISYLAGVFQEEYLEARSF